MSGGAAESDLRRRDADARRRAQTVFDRPLVLEAGAGTGKTSTLVARTVAWCMGPGWARADAALRGDTRPSAAHADRVDTVAGRVLQGVVAITFTEFAAAEMGTRMGEAFAIIEQGKVPEGLVAGVLPPSAAEQRTRARALLGNLDRLVVRTIHAFCRRLLAVHPLEAGLHPHFQVDAEGRLQAEIIRDVLDSELHRSLIAPDSPWLPLLADQRLAPDEIEAALAALIDAAVPPAALAADPFDAERLHHLRRDLHEQLDRFRQAAGPLRAAGQRARLTAETLSLVDQTIGRLNGHPLETGEHLQALCDWFRQTWSDRELDRLADWEKGRFTGTEAECLGDAGESVTRRVAPLRRLIRHLVSLDPSRLDLARRALHPLLDEAYRAMRARGAETYSALLRDARDMLRRHPDVAARVRRRIDQLLVDEFQDTDPVQCDLIRCLALEGPADERPGLFLVGDPKQSIYGWRSADLRAYDDFLSEVIGHGGERHLLIINYRSTPMIIEEVARVIAPVMCAEPGLQPPFEPLLANKGGTAATAVAGPSHAPIEYWVPWGWDADTGKPQPKLNRTDVAELEALALARDIRRMHEEQGIEWREVGVLFRSTSDLDLYLSALRGSAIPYVVERDQNYYQRREIIEAAALLRAVLDPCDQLALLTLLRSCMVGVPDAALIPLWSRRFPQLVIDLYGGSSTALETLRAVIADVAASLPGDIPGIDRVRGWDQNLLATMHSIGALRESYDCDPADVFVERLRTLFLTEATEGARYLGEYRTANLDRFFRHLLDAFADTGSDVRAVLRGLRTGIAGGREAEEGRPKEAAANAVQVMTIHKAKGLDFRLLYVMQLDKGPGRSDSRRTEAFDAAGRIEYRLIGSPSLRFDRVESQRAAVEAAEQVRTLYVAMTRAKERLVLAGRWPAATAPISPGRARCQMDLLQSRTLAPPDLGTLMEETAAKGSSCFADRQGARWVFPVLDARREASIESLATESRVFDADAVAAAAESLHALRERAAARDARAFTGAASEEAHEAMRELIAGRYDGTAAAGHQPLAAADRGNGGRDRRIAQASGTAVHRALEIWDFTVDPTVELEVQCQRLRPVLQALVGTDELDDAMRRAASLLRRFIDGPLFARLLTIAEHVVARELPVLLPPPDGDIGPVGFVAGAVDLLYRDPASGALVVADYKTDAVERPAELADRAKAYAAQGAQYVRAVCEGLRLSEKPRFELWFLNAGRIEVVE